MIHFTIHLLVAITSLCFAFLMGKKGEESKKYKFTAYIVSIILLIPIILKGIFVFFPVLEIYLIPQGYYHYIDRVYPFLFFLPFLSIISTIAPRKQQLILYALLIVFSIFTINLQIWRFSEPECYNFKGNLNQEVCIQSSPYTCGAASMVTLLNSIGVKADEGEMAELSETIPYKGVSNYQAAAGMNMKFKKDSLPYSAILSVYSDKELADIKTPFLVTLKHAFFCDHMVCVLEINDTEVVLGDPLTGKRSVSHEQFLNKWKNVIIEVKKKDEKN